jgi:hypothetical protein
VVQANSVDIGGEGNESSRDFQFIRGKYNKNNPENIVEIGNGQGGWQTITYTFSDSKITEMGGKLSYLLL